MNALRSKDTVGGVFMLFVSLLFLLSAYAIEIPVQQAEEAMTSRTMPIILASIGIALSLILIIRGVLQSDPNDKLRFNPETFGRLITVIGPILIAIPIFGFALDTLGYFPASILLLGICQLALGERRPLALLLGSIIAPFFLWLLVDVLLGMSLPMRFLS